MHFLINVHVKCMFFRHGKVILSKPALLVHCSETNNVICGKDVLVSAPKSSKELNEIQLWKNLTYKAVRMFVENFNWLVGFEFSVFSILMRWSCWCLLVTWMTMEWWL